MWFSKSEVVLLLDTSELGKIGEQDQQHSTNLAVHGHRLAVIVTSRKMLIAYKSDICPQKILL